YAALDRHFPGLKEKYIKQYGNAYEVPSPRSKELWEVFQKICKENGIISNADECFKYMHEFPEKYKQMSMFDL
ncbi:MAG: radical SAM protein, partial [Lachnospiraceae bacterium]|nr:radical SAM protein [Lachnospiraceae bacterium]